MGAVLAGQYAEKRAPFLIDFSIRAASIPSVSYVDVLRGDAATLGKLKGKKVIIGGTALELGDRFSIPNGGDRVRAACCRRSPPNRSCRTARCTGLPMPSRWPGSASLR